MYIHAPGALASLWSEPFRGQVVGARAHEAKAPARSKTTTAWSNKHSFSPATNPSYVAPPQPARFTHSRARAMRKLVVRDAASLDSPVCGHVSAGQSVMVLKEETHIGRVYIGADFAEGVRPLGWVTGEKDGELYLSVEDARPPGAMLNCSPRLQPSRISPRPTHSQETRESYAHR